MPTSDRTTASRVKKGRILRVKAGYNPNSSSVASELTTFLFCVLGAGVFTIAGLNVADLIVQKMRKGKEEKEAVSASEMKPR